jgi:hypothetical protein
VVMGDECLEGSWRHGDDGFGQDARRSGSRIMIACVNLPPSLAGQWPIEAIVQWRPTNDATNHATISHDSKLAVG